MLVLALLRSNSALAVSDFKLDIPRRCVHAITARSRFHRRRCRYRERRPCWANGQKLLVCSSTPRGLPSCSTLTFKSFRDQLLGSGSPAASLESQLLCEYGRVRLSGAYPAS